MNKKEILSRIESIVEREAMFEKNTREVVKVLRNSNWETVDSGDDSNFKDDMECVLPEPMVAVQVDARALWSYISAVRETLVRAGVNMERSDVKVQGSCEWPDYEKGIVLVLGVTNNNLGECPENIDDE